MLGLFVPHVSWEETVVWAAESLDVGVDSLWSNDKRDPVTLLSAIAQAVPGIRLGLFISSLRDRPALMAAKQLITLDGVSDHRLDVLIDDVDLFDSIAHAVRTHLPSQLIEPRMRLWSLDGRRGWPPATIVDTVIAQELPHAEMCIAKSLDRRN